MKRMKNDKDVFIGMPNDFDLSNYHKATVDELIEYFKEMEKQP